jgi:hypothetical protein
MFLRHVSKLVQGCMASDPRKVEKIAHRVSFLIILCCRVLLEENIRVSKTLKVFSCFYVNRKYITMFTIGPPMVCILEHVNPV